MRKLNTIPTIPTNRNMQNNPMIDALGAPYVTEVLVFQRGTRKAKTKDGMKTILPFTCTLHLTHYVRTPLVHIQCIGEVRALNSRMMYVPRELVGQVINSMYGDGWELINSTKVSHEGTGVISMPMSDLLKLLHDAENGMKGLFTDNLPTPEERVCNYLESRKFN